MLRDPETASSCRHTVLLSIFSSSRCSGEQLGGSRVARFRICRALVRCQACSRRVRVCGPRGRELQQAERREGAHLFPSGSWSAGHALPRDPDDDTDDVECLRRGLLFAAELRRVAVETGHAGKLLRASAVTAREALARTHEDSLRTLLRLAPQRNRSGGSNASRSSRRRPTRALAHRHRSPTSTRSSTSTREARPSHAPP